MKRNNEKTEQLKVKLSWFLCLFNKKMPIHSIFLDFAFSKLLSISNDILPNSSLILLLVYNINFMNKTNKAPQPVPAKISAKPTEKKANK